MNRKPLTLENRRERQSGNPATARSGITPIRSLSSTGQLQSSYREVTSLRVTAEYRAERRNTGFRARRAAIASRFESREQASRRMRLQTPLRLLKPLACDFVLELTAGRVDGFACSSLFESRLAREVIGSRGTVHLTSPGLRAGEIGELGELCDYITFNSVSQLRRLAAELRPARSGRHTGQSSALAGGG